MSDPAPCGRPDCPVPRKPPTSLRTVVWQAGRLLRRGHKRAYPDPTALVPGVSATRFAPLTARSGLVEHVYVATTSFAALLESALHDASSPVPRVRKATLADWTESQVALAGDVRLIDLRDDELDRVSIDRSELVATSAAHYPCTRSWATKIHGRSIGGQTTHGLVWHSRQTELHGRALEHRPALKDLVTDHPAEVAVLWAPPAPTPLLTSADGGLGPLDTGDGLAYVSNLTAELAIATL